MPEKTEAQKKAQKKYMASFVEVKVRMTPERRGIIQNHAQVVGESVTAFINRAIDNQMRQDAVGGPTSHAGGGVVSLHSETLKTAQKAAEAAEEAIPQFIGRAVETQVKQDKASLALGINPATGKKLNQSSEGGTDHE